MNEVKIQINEKAMKHINTQVKYKVIRTTATQL